MRIQENLSKRRVMVVEEEDESPYGGKDESWNGATGRMTKYGWFVKSFPSLGYNSALPSCSSLRSNTPEDKQSRNTWRTCHTIAVFTTLYCGKLESFGLWHAHLARDFTGGTPVPLSQTDPLRFAPSVRRQAHSLV